MLFPVKLGEPGLCPARLVGSCECGCHSKPVTTPAIEAEKAL